MIQFHEMPGILLEAVPHPPGSFMVKIGANKVKVKLNFTSDKESKEAVANFVQAYRALFDEDCIGPEGRPMSLHEIVGDPMKIVDQAPPDESFVAIGALAPKPSWWKRLLGWFSEYPLPPKCPSYDALGHACGRKECYVCGTGEIDET